MLTNKRPFILAVCFLLVLLCAVFPPRAFKLSPPFTANPSRKFLFSSELFYFEQVGEGGLAPVHIDTGRFAAELLAILSLTGIALLATVRPRP